MLVKNTRDLITKGPKLKILITGLPGTGKTKFLSTVPHIGIAACETGHGKGLLTIADSGVEYCEPTTLADIESIATGHIFKDKEAIGIDSLSEMARTFIKDAALSLPRRGGDSDKRRRGIPELDDYGIMAELTRRVLRKLLEVDKHVIVTATEKYDKAQPDDPPGTESLIGPDLPGQMFLGSAAMFDIVMRLRTRQKLATPGDPKSRYVERYFVTQPDGFGSVVKCRLNGKDGKPVLDKEEVFDLNTGHGTFPFLLEKVKHAYE